MKAKGKIQDPSKKTTLSLDGIFLFTSGEAALYKIAKRFYDVIDRSRPRLSLYLPLSPKSVEGGIYLTKLHPISIGSKKALT
jgi:hypothetical protein